MLSEIWCPVLMSPLVPQAILESSANMCTSATSEFELKFIQRGEFSFTFFRLQFPFTIYVFSPDISLS